MSDELIAAWDDLNRAIGAILLCHPASMSIAAERLESARQRYEALVFQSAHKHPN